MNDQGAGTVGIVGAGRMGIGMATSFALAGYRVVLIDAKQREKTETEIFQLNTKMELHKTFKLLVQLQIVEEDYLDTLSKGVSLFTVEEISEALRDVFVVFEAVPEVLKAKEDAFLRICDAISDDVLLASTTSSFSVNMLSTYVRSPGRFMNTHWLNPAFLNPLVEVSPGEHTTDLCLEKMIQLLKTTKKYPVRCSASPGFIVPRIQALAMNEAARMVEEGVASAKEIDEAIRIGFGFRFAVLGLLEFIDWGGGDTLFRASKYLETELKEERFAPPTSVETNMREGRIGLKTGVGYYDYEHVDVDEYQFKILQKYVDLAKHLGYLSKSIKV
ncbi:3-hydroxybutyryl-CoA dehydrogenase [Brevibacillus daliensis]|uniref:3-hydroxybutyryl-CoA dehydrogenase n=1 Tax=Brevibacillus daliensis TaxID=2892995 RepID=UPI001E608DA0|nr:3-hydroxybutyryl-CoA dehydrogenase [Brevibacillus daliensis]